MTKTHAAHLTACAENEGGRAILAIQGYANANTAGYFAREAAHYGRALLACPRCHGEGKVRGGHVTCTKCNGSGQK